jgi:hypothetical protein
LALPAWLAAIEHPPPATIVTVFPTTVQTEVVAEAKLTAKPELAVTVSVNGAAPKLTSPGAPKAMVWAA